ncbi:MAG: hypothetical protein ACFFBD_18970 [Candidatus Hodarchaeota archaeon]
MEATQGKNNKSVLSYCETCRRTLRFRLSDDLTQTLSSAGGLFICTFVHKGPKGDPAHILVMTIDQNLLVRHSENPEFYTEASPFISSFNIQFYCEKCQQNLEIPIDDQKFRIAIDTVGYYKHIFIHSQPAHAINIIVSKERQVLQTKVSSVLIAPEACEEEEFLILEECAP